MMAKISSSEVLPAKSVSQAVNTNLKQLDHFIIYLMMVCSTFDLTHVKLSEDMFDLERPVQSLVSPIV